MTNSEHDMLPYALSYAERGWRVLPLHGMQDGCCTCGSAGCRSASKHPRIGRWQVCATTEEGKIRQWWTKWPNANIGIATGRGSGVFVIDVDGPKGRSTLERWRAEYHWKAGTLTAVTGKGFHLYFRQDALKVATSAGKLGDGIDVRGDGGYVVAPPSVHASGHRYSWEDYGCPVSDSPKWLLEDVLDGKPVMAGADAGAQEDVIEEGGRNDTLFKVGCGLRGKGYEVNEILEELMNVNDKRCSPPLPESEVHAIADSAAKYEPNAVVLAQASKDSPLWWFPLNVNDWCSDQKLFFMPDYQVGWYIWLLVECWKTGGLLPNDPGKLAKFARAKSRKVFEREMAAVMSEFEPTSDEQYVVNTRMRQMWEEKAELSRKRKLAAAGK